MIKMADNFNGIDKKRFQSLLLTLIFIVSFFGDGGNQIAYGADDVTPPILNQIEVSMKTARAGDTLTIMANITDDLSGVNNVQINYQAPDLSSKEILLIKDTAGNFQGIFQITETTQIGQWQISDVILQDNSENVSILFNSSIYPDIENATDLSSGCFTIDEPDTTPPELISIAVSPKSILSGETVFFKILAKDDYSGVKSVRVYVMDRSQSRGFFGYCSLDEDGYFTFQRTMNQFDQFFDTGFFKIDEVTLEDFQGNTVTIFRYHADIDKTIDLSSGDFTLGHKVDFDTKGGSEIESVLIDSVFITEPIQPTKTGYIFGGWYKESDCINRWDFMNDRINSNTTLYANWIPNTYWVRFESAGGTVVTMQTAKYNAKLIEPIQPEKTGFVFSGWYKDINYIDKWDFQVDLIKANITLYACWKVDSAFKVLESLQLTKLPSKLTYVEGQNLDLTGLEVTGIYNDESTEVMMVNLDNVSGFDSTTPMTDHIITITVEGKTATFSVDIIARVLDAISITKEPNKMTYVVGQELDLTGMEVTGTYNDQSKTVLAVTTEHISGFDKTMPAVAQVVTVSYEERMASFTVDIIPRVLESIEILNLPFDLNYVVDENFDLTGLEVSALFNDGAKEPVVITLDHISGFDSSAPVAGQVLTITYESMTQTFTVDIIARVLTGIEITKLPQDLRYVVGESLDLTGLEVAGSYNDKTTEILNIAMSDITGFDSTVPRIGQLITITKGGKTATFRVDIIAKALESIKITKLPQDLDYVAGQALDLTGLEVSGIYNDGSVNVLPVDLFKISGFDSSTPMADQIITITVEGKSATFSVDIIERKITEVKLNSYPSKMVYQMGETLDLTGLSLDAIFNDGTTEALAIGDLSVTGFDSSTAANNQVITITYGTWKFTYEVTIQQKLSVSAFAGNNRYHTSALISQATYEQSEIAILAQGMNFPDALAAGPLAYALNAPILLTWTDRLAEETEAELLRLGVKKIIILGGNNAISEAVESNLKDTLGYETQRLAGLNRYTTALEVAEYIKALKGTPHRVVLSSGTSFADALSIGSYAASEGLPILTTSPLGLVQETIDFLSVNNVSEVLVVGGITVIPAEIEENLKTMGITVKRISGDNRESTSAAIASELYQDTRFAVAANGMTFPDALAAAPYAAKHNAPILLVRQDQIHETIHTYLSGSSIHTITVVGGDAAVSEQIRDELLNVIQ